MNAFADLPSAAEATIGHHWWPSATEPIGIIYLMVQWPLVPTCTSMGCRFTTYSLFMDIQNSILDIHNSFLDIHDIQK